MRARQRDRARLCQAVAVRAAQLPGHQLGPGRRSLHARLRDVHAVGAAGELPAVAATGDEPTRYHALKIDLRNLALVPALAIRFGNELPRRPGARVPVLDRPAVVRRGSRAQRRPAGSTPLHDGSPAASRTRSAAARYDVASGHGIGDAKFSVTLGGGIYWRRRNVEFGARLPEPPARQRRAGVEVAGQRTTVDAAAARPAAVAAHLRRRADRPLRVRRHVVPAARRLHRRRDLAAAPGPGLIGDGALAVDARARSHRRPAVRSTLDAAGTAATHRLLPRLPGRLGHARPRLVLVARAGPRRRDVAPRDQRGRRRTPSTRRRSTRSSCSRWR